MNFDASPAARPNIPLAIDPDEVLRFQGYKRGVDVPGPDVLASSTRRWPWARLMAPRAVVRWIPVPRTENASTSTRHVHHSRDRPVVGRRRRSPAPS